MQLPSGKIVYPSTPIYPGSNFTWGEATKNCTRALKNLWIDEVLVATALQIEARIIKTASAMDTIRASLGNYPITVTSWYRASSINKLVGGSKYSRHQYGDGVDWKVNHLSPRQIAAILESSHTDGGYKAYQKFTHTDWRGYKARW